VPQPVDPTIDLADLFEQMGFRSDPIQGRSGEAVLFHGAGRDYEVATTIILQDAARCKSECSPLWTRLYPR